MDIQEIEREYFSFMNELKVKDPCYYVTGIAAMVIMGFRNYADKVELITEDIVKYDEYSKEYIKDEDVHGYEHLYINDKCYLYPSQVNYGYIIVSGVKVMHPKSLLRLKNLMVKQPDRCPKKVERDLSDIEAIKKFILFELSFWL